MKGENKMITLQTANEALKTVYLGVLENTLNSYTDCIMRRIGHTTSNVYGNEIIVPTYINGKTYTLKSKLANIYGKIEITDKAIRCSQNSAGAFVNLLNDEMEQLMSTTKWHLINAFYGDDKPNEYLTEQEKKDYKPLVFNGLKYLFDDNEEFLYGVKRDEIKPITKRIDKFTESNLQAIIDDCNDEIDFIICSPKTKRDYVEILSKHHRTVEIIEQGNEFKCVKFGADIPIATNKNISDNEIYLINTKDFKLYQLCEWQWIEGEDGSILRQVSGRPVYSAQLVKYGNYICKQPQKQIKVIIGEKK